MGAPHVSDHAARIGLSNVLFCNSTGFAAKFKADSIQTRSTRQRSDHQREGLDKARQKVQAAGFNGKMSRQTKGKVSGLLAEWFTAKKSEVGPAFTTANAAARKFTFVTLTLCSSQKHTDNHLKRHGLARFIQEAERKHSAHQWFWRAEPQRNGNIHFHILFAQAIPWQWVRSTWNNILADLGYLSVYTDAMRAKYAEGFKPSTNPNDKRPISQQVTAYREGEACGWTNPNSTDIHALNKTKNAAAYVCKYVSKDATSRKIEGRIWGCSDELRALKCPEFEVTAAFMFAMQHAADIGTVELVQLEHVAIYKGDIAELLRQAAPELLECLNTYYSDVSEWLRNLHPPATPQAPT